MAFPLLNLAVSHNSLYALRKFHDTYIEGYVTYMELIPKRSNQAIFENTSGILTVVRTKVYYRRKLFSVLAAIMH